MNNNQINTNFIIKRLLFLKSELLAASIGHAGTKNKIGD